MFDYIFKMLAVILPTILLCYIAYKFDCYNMLIVLLLLAILYELEEQKNAK